MKMKKITAFIVAILSVLSVASFAPISLVGAEESAATQTDVKFIHGYASYTFSYIVDKFDVELEEGEEVKAYKINGAETASTGDHTFKANENTIEFFSTTEAAAEDSLGSFTFAVVDASAEGSVYYTDLNKVVRTDGEGEEKVEVTAYAKYLEDLNKELTSKYLGDSITYPTITDLLVSDYYPASALKLTLYTCGPTGSTFTSSTGKTIKLDQVGSYSFYVLAQDPSKTSLEVDAEKHVRKTVNGVEGWYDEKDALVAPIFTFSFDHIKQPEITLLTKVTPGYVGLTYKNINDYITIVANNEKVEYKLFFSELSVDLYTGDTWADGGIEVLNNAVEAGRAIDITADEEVGFSTSDLSFTPNKKGYYYLVVVVKDAYGTDDAALNPIKVEAEVTEVKLEKQFLKNNWVSFMFLGIAVLCLIGIILLIFVKPKEEEEVVTEVVRK